MSMSIWVSGFSVVPRSHLYPASPAAPGFTVTGVSLPQTEGACIITPVSQWGVATTGPNQDLDDIARFQCVNMVPESKRVWAQLLLGDPATDARAKLIFLASAVVGKGYLRCNGFRLSWTLPCLSLLRGNDFFQCTNTVLACSWQPVETPPSYRTNTACATSDQVQPRTRPQAGEPKSPRSRGSPASKRASHCGGTTQWTAKGPPQAPESLHHSVAATWASTLH